MPARTFTHTNDFDNAGDPLNGATETLYGVDGVTNSDGLDGDNEWQFNDPLEQNVGAVLQIDPALDTTTDTERVTDFTASFLVEFDSTDAGGGKQDGLAFSFGNPMGLSPGAPNGLDTGTTNSGLVIRIKPLGSEIEVFWKGTKIAEQPITDLDGQGPETITTSATGQVDVSYAGVDFSAQITGTQWQTNSQNNWEFVVSGRAGVHDGLGYIDDLSISANVSCFVAGTGIACIGGERPVEDLAIGDLICTADGRAVPVLWIGRQRLRRGLAMPSAWPVEFAPGALGPGVPHRALQVSPDHGIVLDRLVFNASALVNQDTVRFVPASEIPKELTYYHIETENHDVILANGAPAETFLDAAGRAAFDNHAEYLDLYGAERIIPEMRMPRISTARLVPETVKSQLSGASTQALATSA
ncbi:Hint domain-containing protein [Candidatus Rhodobacter oscarellae]|uniref:Hint domain-containing protein n=1 Tax=Candidatus Rhodobacter oscarellae TaxID=1675527 RepID=UPI0006715FE4|nr:Hint domain-containing protein [Candidatus Rhodobacter lobularis]